MSRIVDISQQETTSGVLATLTANRKPQDFENDVETLEIQRYLPELNTSTYAEYGTAYNACGTLMNSLSGIYQDYWFRIYQDKEKVEELLRSFHSVAKDVIRLSSLEENLVEATEEMLEYNGEVRIPPKRSYIIQMIVESIEKGEPVIIEPESLLVDEEACDINSMKKLMKLNKLYRAIFCIHALS